MTILIEFRSGHSMWISWVFSPQWKTGSVSVLSGFISAFLDTYLTSKEVKDNLPSLEKIRLFLTVVTIQSVAKYYDNSTISFLFTIIKRQIDSTFGSIHNSLVSSISSRIRWESSKPIFLFFPFFIAS